MIVSVGLLVTLTNRSFSFFLSSAFRILFITIIISVISTGNQIRFSYIKVYLPFGRYKKENIPSINNAPITKEKSSSIY